MSYKIKRLDDFGRGITFVDDKICFVFNGLIGEEVELLITNEKSKYKEAETTKIIEESKNRVKPICPYYNVCGGCNLMHMSYSEQLNFKKQKVERILSKYAKLDNVVKEIISTEPFNYRNKVTLKVKDGKIGYFKNKSYELVNIDKCFLCDEKISEIINILNNINLTGINEIVIRCNYEKEILLYLIGNIEDENYADFAIKRFKDSIEAFTAVFDSLGSNTVSTEWLTTLEMRDALFPWMNYRIFSKKK